MATGAYPVAVNPVTGALTYASGLAVGLDSSTVPAADAAVGAAGSSTSAPPADHAHPRYQWAPPDHAYLAWTFDPILAPGGSTGAAAGTLNIARLHLPKAQTITNVLLYVTGAGSTLTSGQCFAGLYSSAGAKLDLTADQAATGSNWQSTGLKTMPLAAGATSRAAGDYYVVWWANGSTLPSMARQPAAAAGLANAGLSAPNMRFATTADTGLTNAASAPLSMGAQSSTGNCWWAALS
jgi:hypothetical protein